uniref:RING-type domain-containing protein n=2 Tax=Oxyrrhis marina TaxID=2969 RepID=A0A6U9LZZ2_OXYMA
MARLVRRCCGLCLDQLAGELVAAQCGHLFHQRCCEHRSQALQCPSCGAEFHGRDTLRIFCSDVVPQEIPSAVKQQMRDLRSELSGILREKRTLQDNVNSAETKVQELERQRVSKEHEIKSWELKVAAQKRKCEQVKKHLMLARQKADEQRENAAWSSYMAKLETDANGALEDLRSWFQAGDDRRRKLGRAKLDRLIEQVQSKTTTVIQQAAAYQKDLEALQDGSCKVQKRGAPAAQSRCKLRRID